MDLRNCPECGHLFVFSIKNLCPKCIEQEEADFKLVKDYLYGNSCADISEISRATGVATKRVIRLLRDSRLVAICEKKKIKILSCERCNSPIINGRFCPECCDSLADALNKMTAAESPRQACSNRESTGKNVFTAHFSR
jgi:hypothetical protein